MGIFLSFLFLLVLSVLSSVIYNKKIKETKQNLPPSPPKLPFIGNLHQLRGMFHRCVHDLSKKYGPVMSLNLGLVPSVVVSSSEAAQEVLKTHDLECCTRPKVLGMQLFSRNGKNIGFASYGEEWRELRKLANIEFLNSKKVRSFRYIREEENDLMMKSLTESALKQSPVDLGKILFYLSTRIVFRSAFGQDISETKLTKIQEMMFDALTHLSYKFSDFFPTAGIGWFMDFVLGQHKKLQNTFSETDTFIKKVIDDHLECKHGRTTQDRPDIVDVMLEMMHNQHEDESFKLTIDHVHGVISDIYFAGIDTSVITMVWAMAELVRNPGMMKKAQDEIRNCIRINQNERIKEADVDKLQYLKLVIQETLRLHPPAPLLLPRETISNIKIQGYDISSKTLILVNIWSIGRDPNRWKNPDEFIPERFIHYHVDYRGQSFEMLPFGSGRRMCPGMGFGIATVELGLLNLLYFFDWKLPDGSKDVDMEEAGEATIVKKVPLELLPVIHKSVCTYVT